MVGHHSPPSAISKRGRNGQHDLFVRAPYLKDRQIVCVTMSSPGKVTLFLGGSCPAENPVMEDGAAAGQPLVALLVWQVWTFVFPYLAIIMCLLLSYSNKGL